VAKYEGTPRDDRIEHIIEKLRELQEWTDEELYAAMRESETLGFWSVTLTGLDSYDEPFQEVYLLPVGEDAELTPPADLLDEVKRKTLRLDIHRTIFFDSVEQVWGLLKEDIENKEIPDRNVVTQTIGGD